MTARRLSWLLVGWCAACASQGAVKTALHGDLNALRQEIERERKAGTLERDRVVDIAEAVAEREVMSGTGPSGTRRIRAMRACSGPLSEVLAARAERPDDGGAEALQVLLAARAGDARAAFDEHSESSSGAWRAVAARAATRPETMPRRRQFFVDVDERVRRAAFEAALEAPSELDLELLLESSRLDPDPLSRSLAARGVGAVGGEQAVLALRDRWDRADEDTRLAIVEAWALPKAYATGGERELISVAESGTDLTALAAADALLRNASSHTMAAITLLGRAIAQGSSDERRLAMRTAPLTDAEVVRVIEEAAKDADPDVRVMALARLLELDKRRAGAQKELTKLAQGKDNTADQARAALAALGDQSVKPALRAALGSSRPGERRVAALGLIRLGDYATAASALADEDATLRATLACTILAREARGR
jgi:hypothetical protein